MTQRRPQRPERLCKCWSRRQIVSRAITVPMGLALPVFGHPNRSRAAVPALDTDFAPASLRDGLPVAEPSSVGFDSQALHAALESVRDGRTNIHSVLVMRRGRLAAELYRAGLDRSLYSLWATNHQFGRSDLHDMRSISKSVVSLLYGILLARGAVPDIETSVPSLFPECTELDDPARRAIRIRHLLTMTAGLEWTEPSPVRRANSTDEIGLVFRESAYGDVFNRPVVARVGVKFTYSGGLTAVLAEIMTRATKRTLRDIARSELFAPLGIVNWEWIGNLFGTPMAAAGLRMTPRDLLKIGALMLAGGQWHGRRIVPAGWILRSTRPKVATEPVGGYGFQWWSTTTRRQNQTLAVTAAWGNGGQRLFLVPALDMAVVTTAGDYGDPAINAPLGQLLQRIVATVAV